MQTILDGASAAGLAAVGVLLLVAVWLAGREPSSPDAAGPDRPGAPHSR